ncbi:MAG: transcription-repair coupling factor [Bacteroidota bacterium]
MSISDSLRNKLTSCSYQSEILAALSDRDSVYVNHCSDSLSSMLVARLARTYDRVLLVFPDEEDAELAFSDLKELKAPNLRLFPSTLQKPYDNQVVRDLSRLVQRTETIQHVQSESGYLVVTSAQAIFNKVAGLDDFQKHTISLTKGESYPLDDLKEQLVNQGFSPTRFVDEPGEFAVRGGIVDLYPFTGDYPIRLEFFGDELESIREFDADSQRSVAFLNEAHIYPNLNPGADSAHASLIDYLAKDTLIVTYSSELVKGELSKWYEQATGVYQEVDKESIPEPEQLFVSKEVWTSQIESFKRLQVGSSIQHDQPADVEVVQQPLPVVNGNFDTLNSTIRTFHADGYEIVLLCDNNAQKERFEELLDLETPISIQTGSLNKGFVLADDQFVVFTDHQIFDRYFRPKVKRKKMYGGISLKEIRDLNIGDFVVHVDYGIGKFAGFKKIEVKEVEQEVVVLRYKDDSLLYVNVSSLHKLQKYSGKEGTEPRITKLGSGEWARKKAQTRKKVKDIARELIQLYAKRKSQKAFAFSGDNGWQTEMEARFEYEETPDQDLAIKSVKEDMQSIQPMDRLICGDVGFGKTEVAVRAAFKAVMDHKQVAVLVPTTILAEQHAKTFIKRMKNFPVRIEALSRFRSPAEQKKVIKELGEGNIDIVIGTHRILSKDISFKELGLVIVDEEQRFGVSAKEKLKEFRASVDVLTLTATPIPRTLQFSLMGARDLSIIRTPPPNRQPVYTEIHSFNEELIRDAILQEMSRGGQVFFIHNRVKNIEEVAEMIRRLVPDIRVQFAHGQMKPTQLEKIIGDFYQHKFDVLVSTNIVENGIDIANANTIIINQADHFGLAELHQLRGRVGRSNQKAFCYLITHPIETLTTEARKRLLALEEFSDLGAGFNIAMRDLDIRGAGDILGAEQSGFINDIGFELYTKIVNDAVNELKETEFSGMFETSEKKPDLPETLVEFDSSALLPDTYVQDNVERLNLYRKLSQSTTLEHINDWVEELEDRFGHIPEAAQHLILASKIKLLASSNYFTKVTIRANRMWLICPKTNSEAGHLFYEEGLFQVLLSRLEAIRPGKYNVIHKDDTVRFVVQEIADLDVAMDVLANMHKDPQPVNT